MIVSFDSINLQKYKNCFNKISNFLILEEKKVTKIEYDKFCGCIIGGAIGDCIGGFYENKKNPVIDKNFDFY